MLQNSNIYASKKIDKTTVDILICKNCKNGNITFDNFIEILGKVSLLMFYGSEFCSDRDAAIVALRRILNDHVFKFLGNLCSTNSEVTLSFDPHIGEALKDVYQALLNIYRVYFPWELASSECFHVMQDKSVKGLYHLLKDFDVCPSVVNKSFVYQMWQDLILNQTYADQLQTNLSQEFLPFNKPNEGKVFKFLYFEYFLVKLAEKAFNIREFRDLELYEKLLLLLERMELSGGWKEISKKLNRTNTSLCLRPGTSEHVSVVMNKKKDEFSDMAKLRQKLNSPHNMNMHDNSDNMLYEVQHVDSSQIAQIVMKYRPHLKQVFEYYCSFGDPLNKNKLKSNKFMKCIKDLGLLEKNSGYFKFTPETVDVMFSKIIYQPPSKVSHSQSTASFNVSSFVNKMNTTLSGGSNQVNPQMSKKKSWMDLDQFVDTMVQISSRIVKLKNLADQFEHFITKGLFNDLLLKIKLSQQNSSKYYNGVDLDATLEYLSDNKWIQVLDVLQQSLREYYLYYADKHEMMDFPMYLRFLQEFEVYPTLASKGLLHSIFYSLSERWKEIQGGQQGDQEVVDEVLFYQSFIVLSLCLSLPMFNDDVQKVCWMVEKMSQSNGPLYVYRNKGFNQKYKVQYALVQPVINAFPQYFNINTNTNVKIGDLLGNMN